MSNDSKYINSEFENFKLDQITSIVIQTQKFKNNIITEWDKVLDFIIHNPDFVHTDEFGNDIKGNLSKVTIKDEYIIDSIVKIYRQIPKVPFHVLKENPAVNILYYSYEPHLINRWIEENVYLGEFDSEGILNNGSAAILRVFTIDALSFLYAYYGATN